MKRFFILFVFISGFSCIKESKPEKLSECDKQLFDFKKENDSLKLALKNYEIQSKKNIKFFLTNNSTKYWRVNSINDRNIENADTRIVWRFDNKNNYNTYGQKNNILVLTEIGDERYDDTFEILSNDRILLNGYKKTIKKISIDTFVIDNNNRIYTLTPIDTK